MFGHPPYTNPPCDVAVDLDDQEIDEEAAVRDIRSPCWRTGAVRHILDRTVRPRSSILVLPHDANDIHATAVWWIEIQKPDGTEILRPAPVRR